MIARRIGITEQEARKIDEQAYNEMNKQKSEAQVKFNAYFDGFEKGIDVVNKLLIDFMKRNNLRR